MDDELRKSNYPGPLGKPLRHEDWYYITDTALTTCIVTVYPGEVVGVPEKIFLQLTEGVVARELPGDDKVLLVGYAALVKLLEHNGFARL